MARMALTLMLLGILAVTGSDRALADVLLIEEVRQAERMELPENGSSMDEVRARFGEPAGTSAAVGDPPITRWDYARWSVYFEYRQVLFTVFLKGAERDNKSLYHR